MRQKKQLIFLPPPPWSWKIQGKKKQKTIDHNNFFYWTICDG